MSKGYPDFFGYSIFPQFGVYQIEHKVGFNIPADSWGTVFEISAKGKVYGGSIGMTTTDKTNVIVPRLTIDGYSTIYPSIHLMLRYGMTKVFDMPFILSEYDPEQMYYTLMIQADMTFASEFKVEIYASAIAAVTAFGDLFWAKLVA